MHYSDEGATHVANIQITHTEASLDDFKALMKECEIEMVYGPVKKLPDIYWV